MMRITDRFSRGVLRTYVVLLAMTMACCGEIEGRVVIENATAPKFRAEENVNFRDGWQPSSARGIEVFRTGDRHTVWRAVGTHQELRAPIVYGVAPSGWKTERGPESLKSGEQYSVVLIGAVDSSASGRFIAK